MEKVEALQILRSDSQIRRALTILFDEAAESAINNLVGGMIKDPQKLYELRCRLEGIRDCIAYVEGQIKKPVV